MNAFLFEVWYYDSKLSFNYSGFELVYAYSEAEAETKLFEKYTEPRYIHLHVETRTII